MTDLENVAWEMWQTDEQTARQMDGWTGTFIELLAAAKNNKDVPNQNEKKYI